MKTVTITLPVDTALALKEHARTGEQHRLGFYQRCDPETLHWSRIRAALDRATL